MRPSGCVDRGGSPTRRRPRARSALEPPNYSYDDVQDTVQYVAAAIRTMHQRAGRKISILGHSQGAFQPVFALRIWPDLANDVEDLIGLGGAYDRGSQEIATQCAQGDACSQSFRQIQTGSHLLAALSQRRLPSEKRSQSTASTNSGTAMPRA